MLFQIQSYIKFLWNSKNQHGVHSPFVFSLITKCFYDRKTKAEYGILKNYRQALLSNKKQIRITDFGAGSRVFKSNDRQIAQIAKTAGITRKRAKLLYRTIHYFQPDTILEIGTSVGLAASALSLGNKKAVITTLEGCPETAKVARENFRQFNMDNIHSVISEFNTYFAENLTGQTTYDCIYFDGNHQKEATLHYFELLLPTITNDTFWIFDDIHWSEEMDEAWQHIKNHPKVTVTIDTFRWGLVFFRKEQEKEHFTIRV